MTVFFVTGAVVLLLYALLIGTITAGWMRLPVFSPEAEAGVSVSVVAALRNEAGNLPALLSSLESQNYPMGQLEFILVDDHSTDATPILIGQYLAAKPLHSNYTFIKLDANQGEGKKAALRAGIGAARGQLILVTDADCQAGPRWVSTMAAFYEKYKPQLILGPVGIDDGRSFFGSMQALEFMSLIASAAGSAGAGIPLMANGANMAFTRKAWLECGGDAVNMKFASGDDMFLLQSVVKKYGAAAVRFCRSHEAIVHTPAILRWNDFVQQRKRWVSKSRGYSDPRITAASLVVLLANGLLLAAALSAFSGSGFLLLFAVFYLVKLIIDLPLMVSYARFAGKQRLLLLFPFTEILNAAYTVYIAVAGNAGGFAWKGRKF